MPVIAKTQPKRGPHRDDACCSCCRPISPDDRVFIDEHGRLFCSVRCAQAWKGTGGPA